MYMANTNILGWAPNATYIPLARVRGNANFMFPVGGNANFSVFRYQHVGIPNAKLWHWGSKPTPGPNTIGFASQWNIGFTVAFHNICSSTMWLGPGVGPLMGSP